MISRGLHDLQHPDCPDAQFENAADAVVAGDLPRLQELLAEHPELVRQRSIREHRSTLLHYVSANGIEDFRQKTPPNIVEITRLLLGAGAEVDAESDAYGGHSTTLGLAATSVHPERAGVLIPLLQTLLDAGASVVAGRPSANMVNDSLANGRGTAAEFLTAHGAPLDLEGAAGVGRLELVRSLFEASTTQQRKDAFAWACQFGRTNVVDFLLDRGVEIDWKLKHHGQTGLHWAAYGGHPQTVQLLLRRGAPVNTRDERFDGTPLDWALHSRAERAIIEHPRYDEVVHLLDQSSK